MKKEQDEATRTTDYAPPLPRMKKSNQKHIPDWFAQHFTEHLPHPFIFSSIFALFMSNPSLLDHSPFL